MFGLFGNKADKKVTQCIDELTQMFPDIADIAKGYHGEGRVPDVVAFDASILGFLYGFAFGMVTIASMKLGFDEKTKRRIIYQSICNSLNRPDDYRGIEYRIDLFFKEDDEKFAEYWSLGSDYVCSLGTGESCKWMGLIPVPDHMGSKVYEVMEAHGLDPLRDDWRGTSDTAHKIIDSKNASISFKEYKKQQKTIRPGFSHKSAKEQVDEWKEYVNALEAREEKRVNLETSPPPKDAAMHESQNEPRGSVEQRLKKLQDLLEKGLITEEEAVSTKAKILNDL